MARNQEKAQSMLYRFREAQASSLGLSPQSTRRPRLASSVTTLKECEKWRGDVLREISRKVSKIQDFGLTDFEVRDLNDEINKLLREKGHWENQILALGGANYKRAVPSMAGGDAGVKAGRGGYKYFGRAKDLPGVKELFTARAKGEDGEAEGREMWQRFQGLPPAYYGDEDEDEELLEEERRGEEEEWKERFVTVVQGLKDDLRGGDESNTDEVMGEIQVPDIPRPAPKPWKQSLQALSTTSTHQETAEADETAKRTQDPQEGGSSKRQKGDQGQAIPSEPVSQAPREGYSIFTAEDLDHPAVPDRAAVERLILMAKKRQLREEYIGA